MSSNTPNWSRDPRDTYEPQYASGDGHAMDIRVIQQERSLFLGKTYAHLFTAILGFVAISMLFFQLGVAEWFFGVIAGAPMAWLLVLGGFSLVGWMASKTAHTAQSMPAQYIALFAYVVAEAFIFLPLLYIADNFAPGVIESAAAITLLGFSGLTAIVFVTRKNFSFLGGLLRWGGICALLLIVAALVFGFELGAIFSVAMIAFAGAAVLYTTSNILHEYPSDRYVGAALELFAAVALMFFYVLRLLIQLQSE